MEFFLKFHGGNEAKIFRICYKSLKSDHIRIFRYLLKFLRIFQIFNNFPLSQNFFLSNIHFFFILGSSWKRVRSTLTPTFSSAKMKKMSGIMSEAIKITSDVIGKNADASQEINVYELFQGKVLQNQQNIALFCIKGKNHYFFKVFQREQS